MRNLGSTNLAHDQHLSIEASTGFARARVGLIIPSSNRLSEPQFRAFMPPDVAVHVTRVQMTGRHQRSLDELLGLVAQAASALADARCDVIVFHCTGNSMEHGTRGERRLLETVHENSGAIVLSTAQAIVEALRASSIERLVLVSPYDQATNDHEIAYLREHGFETIHNVALDVPVSDGFISVDPRQWLKVVRANTRSSADGYFLSCTNTTQIDVVAQLERELGKPIVNSNQATIWACLRSLEPRIGERIPNHPLGRLCSNNK